MNNWSKFLNGLWEVVGGFLLSGNGPSVLACWLIEPGLEKSKSMFPQVDIGKNVVVLDHFSININNRCERNLTI